MRAMSTTLLDTFKLITTICLLVGVLIVVAGATTLGVQAETRDAMTIAVVAHLTAVIAGVVIVARATVAGMQVLLEEDEAVDLVEAGAFHQP
jgi:ABC-type spermidine/putrescine transport system permease subunit II